jgi:hypothetical protein
MKKIAITAQRAAVAMVPMAVLAAGVAPAATAATVHPETSITTAVMRPAVSCGTPPNAGEVFQRCTGTTWIGVSCSSNTNYNANPDAPFNVYEADNGCFVRVWLHQDPWNSGAKNWGGGWTYCVTAGFSGQAVSIPAAYQHPNNIYISASSYPC